MNKHTINKGGYDSCIEAGSEYWFVQIIHAGKNNF